LKLKLCSLIFSNPLPEQDFLSLGSFGPRFFSYFGGRYTYLDLFLSSLHHAGTFPHLIITNKYAEITHNYMTNTWGDSGWKILPFISEDSNVPFDKNMHGVLKSQLANWVFFGQADHPFYGDLQPVLAAVKRRTRLIIPVVENKQSSLVLVEKSFLLDVLASLIKKKTPASQVFGIAFQSLLRHSKADKLPIAGYTNIIKNLPQYFTAQFDVLKKREVFNSLFKKMPLHSGIGEKGQALIGSQADFSRSFISDKCVVHGTVHNSILFPGVVVGKGAEVVNSVLFPNVMIGENAKVNKALIDEGTDLPQNIKAHIGRGTKLGKVATKAVNKTFPELFTKGFTYISRNVIIPHSLTIGANCYLEPGTGRSSFRRTKTIADGRNIMKGGRKTVKGSK